MSVTTQNLFEDIHFSAPEDSSAMMRRVLAVSADDARRPVVVNEPSILETERVSVPSTNDPTSDRSDKYESTTFVDVFGFYGEDYEDGAHYLAIVEVNITAPSDWDGPDLDAASIEDHIVLCGAFVDVDGSIRKATPDEMTKIADAFDCDRIIEDVPEVLEYLD